MNKFKTIEWKEDHVLMLDQRKLPTEETYIECKTSAHVAKAIKQMVIRGAPAIGVAAAMGIALGAKKIKTKNKKIFFLYLDNFDFIYDAIIGKNFVKKQIQDYEKRGVTTIKKKV